MHLHNVKRLLPALLLVLLICGCRKDISPGPIDSTIHLRMWETLDSTGRELRFECSTAKSYGCCNYEIGHAMEQEAGKINIEFGGIIVPYMCLTSIGPATATIELGSLSNGTYDLDIQLQDQYEHGQLVVAPGAYAIHIGESRQLLVDIPILNRVPAETIWGNIGYHSSTTAPLVQTFIDSLQLLGATPQGYQAGEYGYFRIDGNGQIMPPENAGHYFDRPYILTYTGGSTALKELVRRYGAAHGDEMSITLNTAKGERFMSWVQ